MAKKKFTHTPESRKKISDARKEQEALKKQALSGSLKPRVVSMPLKERTLAETRAEKFLNMTPESVRSILDSTESGVLRQWSEFCQQMLQDDSHLEGLVTQRKNAVAYTDLYVEPGIENDDMAMLAAAHIRVMFNHLASSNNLQETLVHLLDAPFVGFSFAYLDWKLRNGRYILDCIKPYHSKFFRYNSDYELEFQPSIYQTGACEKLSDYPFNWIVHTPKIGSIFPTKAGLFRPAAWLYFLKRCGQAHRMAGSEKYAFPIIKGSYNSVDDEVIQQAHANLKDMVSSNVIVYEQGLTVDTLNQGSAQAGSELWKSFCDDQDKAYSVLIMGGTLTVGVDGKGSYQLGEVHERVRQHILIADAEALIATIMRYVVVPYFKLNLHLFGGKMPPLPRLWFDIKPYIPIEQWHLPTGTIVRNDIRESLGLPRLAFEAGGDQLIVDVASILSVLSQFGSGVISQSGATLLLRKLGLSEAEASEMLTKAPKGNS